MERELLLPTPWSEKRPKQEGWYWAKITAEANPVIVRVMRGDNETLHILIPGTSRKADLRLYDWWSGPLRPPVSGYRIDTARTGCGTGIGSIAL